MKGTLWHRVIKYFNKNATTIRQQYHRDFNVPIPRWEEPPTRLDDYKVLLTRAGYLKSIRRGVYLRLKTILETTITEIRAQADG